MATLGGEQEYFLIDSKFLEKRMDLLLAGRSLFGAPPPKGQEMEDHYFGSLHERVASFMNDLNNQLWKLGVLSKTQHNEVAPAQYEIAPVFATVNVGVDHNQLTMETLQKVARQHGFACLLHEKPFAGVNGSGKHNNWSLTTDDGQNLLNPGATPHDNMQFLVFLFAVIRAVDKYAGLLRATVASPGNDHRLGANEAPPAIVSIFLGDQLTDIFEQIEKGGAKSSKQGGRLALGVTTLPPLPKDSTDRNRTSPFAFTGNKFEFRMPGSAQSLGGPNFVLNTIVAETLSEIATELEGAKNGTALNVRVQALLQKYAKQHKRIVFNGDGYTEEWQKEAAKRGLPNLKNTVDSVVTVTDKENVAVITKHNVLTEEELTARQEIMLENYVKTINIEAQCMLQMARRQFLPAALKQTALAAAAVNSASYAKVKAATATKMLKDVCEASDELSAAIDVLDKAVAKGKAAHHGLPQAKASRDLVFPAMVALRKVVDGLEKVTDAEIWPVPTYAQMLFER